MLVLPAVLVELLPEVAEVVEETDGDERNAEVAGRLEVVPREHAEAARVLGQRLGDTELGREVGDGAEVATLVNVEPELIIEVAREVVEDRAGARGEDGILCEAIEALLRYPGQEGDGVVTIVVPQVGVDPTEDVADVLVAEPAEVHREILQWPEAFGQASRDGIGA